MSDSKKIIVVGAGLCGTLLAVRLAQRGHQVALYEKRSDMRKETVDAGRSINLALSSRGLLALERVGLKANILNECIPMHGRMIHPLGADSFLSPYSGRSADYINSVSRSGLNITLLNEASKLDNLELRFDCACKQVDLATATATFEDRVRQTNFTVEGAVVIGTDGIGSTVRKSMMRQSSKLLFNFSQTFLRHGYKELSILPKVDGSHRIDKNALHIWPRGHFMIIALPNLDGSFTVTMFHPFEGDIGFNNLQTKEQVQQFFERYFPDIPKLAPHYLEEYFENPTSTLGTVKCDPWQAYGKTLIMGDASHAIVPFYGQGMNSSFEDVRVFDDLLDEYHDDWSTLFKRFEEERINNANAIADLAIDNFYEMRDHVDDENFMKKRKVEMQLEQNFQDYYSKYSLVTFKPNMPYAAAMKLGRAQDDLLLQICDGTEVDQLSLKEVHQKLMALRNSAEFKV